MVKIMENPIKIDDLWVPLFLETPVYMYIFIIIDIIEGNVKVKCSWSTFKLADDLETLDPRSRMSRVPEVIGSKVMVLGG